MANGPAPPGVDQWPERRMFVRRTVEQPSECQTSTFHVRRDGTDIRSIDDTTTHALAERGRSDEAYHRLIQKPVPCHQQIHMRHVSRYGRKSDGATVLIVCNSFPFLTNW
jgi:hypothetical protein